MLSECHAHVFMNGYDYKEAVSRHKGHPDMSVVHTWFEAYRKAGIDFVRDGGDRYGVSEGARAFAMDYGIDYLPLDRTPGVSFCPALRPALP